MATLEELQRKKRQIDAQISDKKRALAHEERKARNHALMVVGGLLVSQAPGGDWKRIDWDALASWIDRYGHKVAEFEAEELPAKEAAARLREWQHMRLFSNTQAQAREKSRDEISNRPAGC